MIIIEITPNYFKIADKNGKTFASIAPDLFGKNVIFTDRRYAADFPRMDRICKFFENKLAVVIRTGYVKNAPKNVYPKPASEDYIYRLPA